MTVLWDFPLASSWSTLFFLSTLFSWRNLQNKMASFRVNICCNIEIFLIKESLSNL